MIVHVPSTELLPESRCVRNGRLNRRRSRCARVDSAKNRPSERFRKSRREVESRTSVESFDGRSRDECLDLRWFIHPARARVIIETWRRDYNEIRPHSSLGNATPSEDAASLRVQREGCEAVAA